ncbi:MAG: MoaD/ThiS family protein [Candidatus Azotimanducaceae bacterium]|uniref:MoaD/ThiS family protein n=1 Tax=OM182 bacterium TaxID=2510334 RepID=A0A520S4L8_9GAMM|nr:molybdopterin synthase sulfur carrier subunit [Gammaproteobacteria bacterium]OUV68173.1 MAG: molybdopterin synthase sulfur carrier subunit [Gammaproteobacteria bacterium TMED133]RZO77339.1 MAG: MoaD/ThiS family protein [OM182 bacterium]
MQVNLTGSLRSAVNGEEVVEIKADTIRELLSRLLETYPAMKDHMDTGIAVSIDGEIYRDSPSKKLPAGSEVFLLPRLQGG